MSWKEVASLEVPPSVVMAQYSMSSKARLHLLLLTLIDLLYVLCQSYSAGGFVLRASKPEKGNKTWVLNVNETHVLLCLDC